MALLLLLPIVAATEWACISLQETKLAEGVVWKTVNCSMSVDALPLLTVNSIHMELGNPNVRAVPGVADPAAMVQSVPDMAKANYLAGINGGYFWRVDIDSFWLDDVCQGKVFIEIDLEYFESKLC